LTTEVPVPLPYYENFICTLPFNKDTVNVETFPERALTIDMDGINPAG
jgi:hypothetical protein